METKKDDSLIKLETLEKEYANLLSQYEEANKNFQDTLDTGTEKEMVAINGRSWNGTKTIEEVTAETQDDCANTCSANSECSGATYNPDNKYCSIRSGESILTTGQDTDVALLPKLKMNMLVLSQLNKRLMDINMQMSNEFKILNPKLETQKMEKSQRQAELDESYVVLSEDKKQMTKLLEEYNTIEQEYQNQSLIVNQANTVYKLWSFLACVVVLILYKINMGDSLPNSAMFIVIFMIVIIFAMNLNLWSLLIVVLIIALIKVLMS